MSIFKLPDLGEGLPDAEIHEWHVKAGDTVETDQPLVSMETAKAVVEVPAPYAGVIKTCFGKPGDLIDTGAPLIEYENNTSQDTSSRAVTHATTSTTKKDSGTVAGTLEESDTVVEEIATVLKHTGVKQTEIKAMPATRSLAKELKVDLTSLKGTGAHGLITALDVKRAANIESTLISPAIITPKLSQGEALKGTRRAMAHIMASAHASVVPVTIFDDVDIHAWPTKTDITLRLMRAIVAGLKAEPALNAWFDGTRLERQLMPNIDLGIAMDVSDGLFVPVIRNLADLVKGSGQALREQLDTLKVQVEAREVPPDVLQGATFTLSNFGKFAGRYANPIVVPPQVAILAAGRTREHVIAKNHKIEVHYVLPLSLSFDHRAITGGEATRFLGVVMNDLQAAK